MKTSAWIVAAGLALGMNAAAIAAPATLDDTADLTPRYKLGQVITFKQHTVRKDTMTIVNLPAQGKDDKPADGAKEPAKADPAKADAPKTDAPKSDPAKTDPAKPEAPKAEAAKAEAPKADPPKPAAGPLSSTTTFDQIATYELRVTDAGDKGVSMDVELKAVACTAELSSGKFTWNSETPEDDKDVKNPVMMSFRPIIGAVLKINVGPDGNIVGVTPDARVNINGRSPLAAMVQQLASADGIRLRFGSVLWIKDGHEPATTGKPWTNTDELFFAAVGKFVHLSSNTLKSVKDGLAQIDITGQISLVGAEAGKPPAGTLKEQYLKGACTWDTKAGLVKSHTWEQKTTMDLRAAGAFDVIRSSEFSVTTTRE